MSNRIENKFAELKSANRKGLFPFLVAGQINLDFTIELIKSLQDVGVSGIELGFPFTDPIADGPVIQSAFTKALKGGTNIKEIFGALKRARSDISIPIVGMVSASIIYKIGRERFFDLAKDAGFDGFIIPDLSLEEADQVKSEIDKRNLCLAMLVAPTTPQERMEEIAVTASGFIYYISVTGITGEREKLPEELPQKVAKLKELSGLPILVGFGINRPDQVKMVCEIADGAIVGSAIVRRISQAEDDGKTEPEIITLIKDYTSELLTGIETS